jgi:dinuclear metal center YbgI/SA1388 family protein
MHWWSARCGRRGFILRRLLSFFARALRSGAMKIADLLAAMEAIAPLRHAEPWDNVGLLAGDPAQPLSKVLLTIDYTMAVAEEGNAESCDAVVAYHPPIFGGLKRIPSDGAIAFALRRGVAIYSPHTALDAASAGTNDVLADIVGIDARVPIRASAVSENPRDDACKLVTYVPEQAIERVSAALFAAGAGHIGRYSSCSFRSFGTGTFFGEAGTTPNVGEAGRLERVDEVRLETVVPLARVRDVVAALRGSHPYEEPAFDLVRLAPTPGESRAAYGMGRIGLVAPTSRAALFARIKSGLGIEAMLVAGKTDGVVTRVAVAAGSAGDLLSAAIAQGAEVVVTGEVRHHDALAAAAKGVTVVCALHSQSERVTLAKLAEALVSRLPSMRVHLSQKDRDPFVIL